MDKIFLIEDIKELQRYLLSIQDINTLREQLLSDFLIYSDYKNVEEWNRAVRLCECLAIIEWGKYEPVQAVRGVFFNGNPETTFYNKFGEPRFVDAIWSKRKDGYTMEHRRTMYHHSPLIPDKPTADNHPVKEHIQDLKLASQRNWIPKSPVLIRRDALNCYESSRAVIESIENDLQPGLDANMQPELYGNTIDRIVLSCSYSYYDNDCCKTNHIIADEALKLKHKDFYPQLLTMYTQKEIEDNGYFLRNRYEYGNFKDGSIRVQINFEKQLSELSPVEQKTMISKHIIEALNTIIDKLKKKKIDYNFDLMLKDFLQQINAWKEAPLYN